MYIQYERLDIFQQDQNFLIYNDFWKWNISWKVVKKQVNVKISTEG